MGARQRVLPKRSTRASTLWAAQQASDAARRLFPLGPLAVVTSPLQRARETSEPLAKLWQREAVIDPAVPEIPITAGAGARRRAPTGCGDSWLAPGTATLELAKWREDLIAALTGFPEDTVVFSHYVAINVAVSAALRDARVTIFHPDNCSVTIFDADQQQDFVWSSAATRPPPG